jgi:hypothetical protein
MRSSNLVLGLLGAVMIMISIGCAGGNLSSQGETPLDTHWGRSYETARYQQILNPEAEEDLSPVIGIEGLLAERIIENYIKGVAQEKESTSGEIGILKIN